MGHLALNCATRQAIYHPTHGTPSTVDLTNKEFQLLDYFLRHPHQILTTEQVRNQLWEMDTETLSNVVAAQVRLLRRKLATLGIPDPIETLHGVGYRFGDAP